MSFQLSRSSPGWNRSPAGAGYVSTKRLAARLRILSSGQAGAANSTTLPDLQTYEGHVVGGTFAAVEIGKVVAYLIEEIVGDIQDEYDLEDEWLVEEADGKVLVDGRLNIEDFEEHFEVEVEREKFDTVGGYIVEHLGRVPTAGEKVVIDEMKFQVVASDQRAIRQLRVSPPPAESAEG